MSCVCPELDGLASCAGRRRYPEALQIFLQGLTAPTYVVNAITVATYKKYTLVCLIHNGKTCHRADKAANACAYGCNGYLWFELGASKVSHMQSAVDADAWQNYAGSLTALPKFTPASVTRFLKTDAQAYTDLAAAYTSKKQEDLPSAIEKHQGHFVEVGPVLQESLLDSHAAAMLAGGILYKLQAKDNCACIRKRSSSCSGPSDCVTLSFHESTMQPVWYLLSIVSLYESGLLSRRLLKCRMCAGWEHGSCKTNFGW